MVAKTKQISRKEQELSQRKAYLLARAEELFAEQGYENTSMAMIAEKSEFSVGTVYNFFPSKLLIYSELVIWKLNEIQHGIIEISENDENPVEKIRNIIKFLLEYFYQNDKFIKIYLLDLTRLGWDLPSNLGENEGKILFKSLMLVDTLIKSAQQNGLMNNNLSSQRITIIFGELLISYLHFWIKEGKKTDLRDSAPEMFEIFMNGVGTKE